MNRREFLRRLAANALLAASASPLLRTAAAFAAETSVPCLPFIPTATASQWLAQWEKNILAEAKSRYCDKEMGEELGWLISPFLNGFYYGYLATRDPKWINLLVDWTDSVLKRAQKEPDGFPGWPKGDGGGKDSADYSADSLLGEAMLLTPVVQMSAEILKTPALNEMYADSARAYLGLAKTLFQKWDSRDCWRTVKNGGLWVVPDWGVDKQNPSKWSAGYADRKTTGFSNPANKQNLIANWLIALHDATGDTAPGQRAKAWWRLMRSRITTRDSGKYFVWNYWEPGGAWDFKSGGTPKHWIGVHPNGGYYGIDVDSIVNAYEHGLVFQRADVDCLIATNRDFMWNQKIEGAKFQCIDGGAADPRWRDTPGVLWTALAPHDETLRKIFLANFQPATWSGLATTPWAVSRQAIVS